jgi:cbb3-type cytochrome oxidase subunit 1
MVAILLGGVIIGGSATLLYMLATFRIALILILPEKIMIASKFPFKIQEIIKALVFQDGVDRTSNVPHPILRAWIGNIIVLIIVLFVPILALLRYPGSDFIIGLCITIIWILWALLLTRLVIKKRRTQRSGDEQW